MAASLQSFPGTRARLFEAFNARGLFLETLSLVQLILSSPGSSKSALNNPERDQKGRTLLHYAVESRRTAAIDILIGSGFNHIRELDFDGRTALHNAAAIGNLAAVKKLLEVGASSDLYVLDGRSRTPLEVAKAHKQFGVERYLELFRDPHDISATPEVSHEQLWQDQKEKRVSCSTSLIVLSLIMLSLMTWLGRYPHLDLASLLFTLSWSKESEVCEEGALKLRRRKM